MNIKDIKITLLAGGASSEREVSKLTGKNIYQALINLSAECRVYDPALGDEQPDNIEDIFSDKFDDRISSENYIKLFSSDLLDGSDIVFLGLHGAYGEDGAIQALLELKEIKYTGSGVAASSLAMDKNMSKIIFRHFGVPTADWFVIDDRNFNPKKISDKIEKEIGFPCIIKPNDGGSTIGLSYCNNSDEIEEAVRTAFKYSKIAMAEKYIAGRELTVGILNDLSLPVLEIKPKHLLYDYECKYTDGLCEYETPADIPADIESVLRRQALIAYKSLGCSNYGRIDFRLTPNNKYFCFEANTLPGLTSHSLVPKMAEAMGIDFTEMIERIVLNAAE